MPSASVSNIGIRHSVSLPRCGSRRGSARSILPRSVSPAIAGHCTATQLKVAGIELYSAGDFAAGDGTEALVMQDHRNGIYKRLVIQNNRLRGAVLYGDAAARLVVFRADVGGPGYRCHARPVAVRSGARHRMIQPRSARLVRIAGSGAGFSRARRRQPKSPGDPQHPANFGSLCSKGAALGDTVGLEERLLYPQLYGQRASWEEALTRVAREFQRRHSTPRPGCRGSLRLGQLLTEDYYVANKLMKGFIGSANIDTNSRLCMASAVAGHRRAFGGDLVPGCYEDLTLADLIVLTGSNMAWCHPVLFRRIVGRKGASPGAQARRHRSAAHGDR